MAAKIAPIVVMLPVLFLNFSVLLPALFWGVLGLLLFRIFVIFPKIACFHCRARNIYPNAQSMRLSKQ